MKRQFSAVIAVIMSLGLFGACKAPEPSSPSMQEGVLDQTQYYSSREIRDTTGMILDSAVQEQFHGLPVDAVYQFEEGWSSENELPTALPLVRNAAS